MRLPYGDNASQSKTYGTFHDLLNDTLMVFGVADYQRSKCLQVAQTFSSVWDELHRDTQEALIKDLREKLVKAEEAKAKWRQENPDRKWTWDWRIAIEYLPDAYRLVKLVSSEHQPWFHPLPRELLDGMLQEFHKFSDVNQKIQRKEQEIAKSDVRKDWNSFDSACQLEMLDYTRGLCDELNWYMKEERVVDPRLAYKKDETSIDPEKLYPKLDSYKAIIRKHQVVSQVANDSSILNAGSVRRRQSISSASTRRRSGDPGPYTAQPRFGSSEVLLNQHESQKPAEQWKDWFESQFL